MRLKQVILALFIVRFCVNISLSLLRFGIMVVREKNCYYAIALTDFFVFLSCAEEFLLSFYLITDNQNFHLQIRFFQRWWALRDGFLVNRRNTLNNLPNKLLL